MAWHYMSKWPATETTLEDNEIYRRSPSLVLATPKFTLANCFQFQSQEISRRAWKVDDSCFDDIFKNVVNIQNFEVSTIQCQIQWIFNQMFLTIFKKLLNLSNCHNFKLFLLFQNFSNFYELFITFEEICHQNLDRWNFLNQKRFESKTSVQDSNQESFLKSKIWTSSKWKLFILTFGCKLTRILISIS